MPVRVLQGDAIAEYVVNNLLVEVVAFDREFVDLSVFNGGRPLTVCKLAQQIREKVSWKSSGNQLRERNVYLQEPKETAPGYILHYLELDEDSLSLIQAANGAIGAATNAHEENYLLTRWKWWAMLETRLTRKSCLKLKEIPNFPILTIKLHFAHWL